MADIVERLRKGIEWTGPTQDDTGQTENYMDEAADTITALRAEVERLRVENIQMQAALGYGILAEDERHILPSNPFKCGICDANKHLRAENERLRAALWDIHAVCNNWDWFIWMWPIRRIKRLVRAALEEKQND